MQFNPQFKLTFFKMEIQFDIESRQNKDQETQLFTAPAEITVIDPTIETNGTPIVEVGLPNQDHIRCNPTDNGR